MAVAAEVRLLAVEAFCGGEEGAGEEDKPSEPASESTAGPEAPALDRFLVFRKVGSPFTLAELLALVCCDRERPILEDPAPPDASRDRRDDRRVGPVEFCASVRWGCRALAASEDPAGTRRTTRVPPMAIGPACRGWETSSLGVAWR